MATTVAPPFDRSRAIVAIVGSLRKRDVQALHAAISTRNWHAVECAANSIRDALDRLAIDTSAELARTDQGDRLRACAQSLRQQPYVSATMAEAKVIAARILVDIADELCPSPNRNCDDCDFRTTEGDVVVCPQCRGSVG